MKLLKRLYETYSPSGKENRIRTFIKKHIAANIPDAVVTKDAVGNLYITRGFAEDYPCIVAHLDQVQKVRSKDFRAVETRDLIFGYSPANRRQEGLGADDKNGIWIALRCLEKYEAIKVAFFVGEEVGCVGSNAADMAFFEDCRFVIEPDRRGYRDLITQISWENICSEEFLLDMNIEKFGYIPTEGLMTDVEALRSNGISVSCINLSCGYYEPHTDYEFTVKEDLMNCLCFVQHIIENCTKIYTHLFDENDTGYHYGYGFGDYNATEDMMFDIMMGHPDYTPEDVWDTFCMNFPELSKGEFLEMYEERMLAYGMDIPTESALISPKKKTQPQTRKKNRFANPLSGFKSKTKKKIPA